MVEVVSLLVFALLHEEQTSRERLACRFANVDIFVVEVGQNELLEGFHVLIEMDRGVRSHLLQN